MIKIITDSGSDILQEECDKVRVLPLHVSFGEEHYRDGVDLLHEMFCQRPARSVLMNLWRLIGRNWMLMHRQERDR